MAVFAIADLHLSLNGNKPMDVFPGWESYVEKLEKNWKENICDNDIVIIAGDVSWAMSLEEALADFQFLDRLPGKKVILKGNHDFWWNTRKKMDTFFETNGLDSLQILHNDMTPISSVYGACGSRGWFLDAEEDADKKIVLREAGRLRTSIQMAKKDGLEPIVFLHYPPYFAGDKIQEIWQVLTEENIHLCYYGHIHGNKGIQKAFNGCKDGINLRLISADALDFCPIKVI